MRPPNHLEVILNHRENGKPFTGFWEGVASVAATGMDKVKVMTISGHHGRVMKLMKEQGWTFIRLEEDDWGDEDCPKWCTDSYWEKQ